jgi:Na+/alanine symporter
MSADGTITVTKMTVLAVTGNVIGFAEINEIARLLSFVVPTILSVYVFVRDQKKRKDNETEN